LRECLPRDKVLLSTFAQINPVWEDGPYTPLAISSGTQPDFYLGLLDGALRIMPPSEISFLGHTLSLSILIRPCCRWD